MSGARLTAALECANDARVRFTLRRPGDSHGASRLSADAAASCASADRPASAVRAAPSEAVATPQSEGLVRARTQVCFHTPAPALLGSLPSHRSFQEGCWTDEAGYARHHRHRSGSGRRPRFPGAVPRHGRQPGSGPHRLPRSGPSHRDPRLVLHGHGRRRRARREPLPLCVASMAPAACKTPRPGQAARLAHLAERCRALARDRRAPPSDRSARERAALLARHSRDRGCIRASSSSAPSAPARPPPACTRSPSSSSRGKPTGPGAGPVPLC